MEFVQLKLSFFFFLSDIVLGLKSTSLGFRAAFATVLVLVIG